jgi:hypothetical protein
MIPLKPPPTDQEAIAWLKDFESRHPQFCAPIDENDLSKALPGPKQKKPRK